ncbi:hypothetical protein HMI56_004751 [Coelomomyces lativittatus]|nr:hypothetical protein HMI56_004751 [Coelomomyces lativittatus]
MLNSPHKWLFSPQSCDLFLKKMKKKKLINICLSKHICCLHLNQRTAPKMRCSSLSKHLQSLKAMPSQSSTLIMLETRLSSSVTMDANILLQQARHKNGRF